MPPNLLKTETKINCEKIQRSRIVNSKNGNSGLNAKHSALHRVCKLCKFEKEIDSKFRFQVITIL